jgi:hypothetical protein
MVPGADVLHGVCGAADLGCVRRQCRGSSGCVAGACGAGVRANASRSLPPMRDSTPARGDDAGEGDAGDGAPCGVSSRGVM